MENAKSKEYELELEGELLTYEGVLEKFLAALAQFRMTASKNKKHRFSVKFTIEDSGPLILRSCLK